MEECNKSYGANNHTSLLSHAQSQSPFSDDIDIVIVLISSCLALELEIDTLWFIRCRRHCASVVS